MKSKIRGLPGQDLSHVDARWWAALGGLCDARRNEVARTKLIEVNEFCSVQSDCDGSEAEKRRRGTMVVEDAAEEGRNEGRMPARRL